jgi:hypothetical protein
MLTGRHLMADTDALTADLRLSDELRPAESTATLPPHREFLAHARQIALFKKACQ